MGILIRPFKYEYAKYISGDGIIIELIWNVKSKRVVVCGGAVGSKYEGRDIHTLLPTLFTAGWKEFNRKEYIPRQLNN